MLNAFLDNASVREILCSYIKGTCWGCLKRYKLWLFSGTIAFTLHGTTFSILGEGCMWSHKLFLLSCFCELGLDHMLLTNKAWPVFEYCHFFFFLMLMGKLMARLKEGLQFLAWLLTKNRFAGTPLYSRKKWWNDLWWWIVCTFS